VSEDANDPRRAIEAILMVADDPVEPHLLAQLLELAPARVEQICTEMAAAYEAERRGFILARVAGGYRFQSAPDLAPYLERFVLEGQSARLSAAALETLAIVAYKQPLSRAQVAAIRGVNVDGVMRTLQQRGYIAEVGRDPGPGQAVLFGTTPSFLEKLGLDSVDDLPPLGAFVPGPEVMEALEHGLRVDPEGEGPVEDPDAADEEDLTGEALADPSPGPAGVVDDADDGLVPETDPGTPSTGMEEDERTAPGRSDDAGVAVEPDGASSAIDPVDVVLSDERELEGVFAEPADGSGGSDVAASGGEASTDPVEGAASGASDPVDPPGDIPDGLPEDPAGADDGAPEKADEPGEGRGDVEWPKGADEPWEGRGDGDPEGPDEPREGRGDVEWPKGADEPREGRGGEDRKGAGEPREGRGGEVHGGAGGVPDTSAAGTVPDHAPAVSEEAAAESAEGAVVAPVDRPWPAPGASGEAVVADAPGSPVSEGVDVGDDLGHG
jgi:segregation and condensation protein B